MFFKKPFCFLRYHSGEANYNLLSIVTSSVMSNLDAFHLKDLIVFLFKSLDKNILLT